MMIRTISDIDSLEDEKLIIQKVSKHIIANTIIFFFDLFLPSFILIYDV